MCLLYVSKIIVNERKLNLDSYWNWILKIGFSICIFKICSNDLDSVEIIRSFNDSGLIRAKKTGRLIFGYVANSIRIFITCISYIAITIFIWTKDIKAEENVLD